MGSLAFSGSLRDLISSELINLWHYHISDTTVVNQEYTEGPQPSTGFRAIKLTTFTRPPHVPHANIIFGNIFPPLLLARVWPPFSL